MKPYFGRVESGRVSGGGSLVFGSAATFRLSTFPGNDLTTIRGIGTRTFVCFKEAEFYWNTTSSSLEGGKGNFDDESRVLEIGNGDQKKYNFGSGGGNEGGGLFGGEGGDEGENGDERDFGPILKFEDVMKEANARGVELPSDMLEAAKSNGLRKLFVLRYLDLQIVIDSCRATFAEVQKRGKDFWTEFELYLADLLVGIVVDIALVSMLAPYARFGQPSPSRGLFGSLQRATAALPISVFEAERPGCKFSVKQRIVTYFYKGVLYGSVGFGCGLVGQGIANLIMTTKRNIRKSDENIPVPPLVESAALWVQLAITIEIHKLRSGYLLVSSCSMVCNLNQVFSSGVSSNTRYQIINGIERLVEASLAAKQVPPLAMAFTVGVWFANNIYGGMQFVDWAKWSGVQ
ncbi:Phototropic-responsive NPH3 family protein isoform 1 [Hibiscus syriacus]|uniref:Phototropic-responsive NPH3 family protein isoform 1 n=1 Tax=Hibiscus syriacus TaxID=106335 RepID=A0A6A3ARV4_HIBSY|nr:Phototropic-responsive NPH3 family protein isoform 1 [Hibiscus syriacus]